MKRLNKITFSILFLLNVLPAHAKVKNQQISKRKPSEAEMHIIPLDGSPAWKRLETKETKVYTHEEQSKIYMEGVPSTEVVNGLLEKCGLNEYFVDHFEKDMFFLRAQAYEAPRFLSLYEKIPKSKLVPCYNEIQSKFGKE